MIWPYYSLCYPLIQKTRKQVTSDFRSNPTSRRSSTSSPRDGSTVNMSYEKENQVKFCKNDETVAKQKDVNRIIAGCRNCFPRSELSERPGFNSKFQDQTSQKTKQTEHEKHSESSCRCSDVEKVQDLEIQNVFPVSAEKMKPPLIKNVEVKSRSEILSVNKKVVTEETQDVNYPTMQSNFKSEINRDFVLCSVETQTSLIETVDLVSEETKVSQLGNEEENQMLKSKVDLSRPIESMDNMGQALTVSDTKNKTILQESLTDDNILHKKENDFQKHNMSRLEEGEQMLESGNVQKTKQLHDVRENERNSDYTTCMPKKSELSSLTNVTSVWDSVSSYQDITSEISEQIYPSDRESLQEMRKNIAMELLWVQQAINSRKNYLRLKKDMDLSNTAATRS